MPRPGSEYPTQLELEILKVLWEEAPLLVRQVQQRLAEGEARRPLAHTSVITILNIMVRKKYLSRTKKGRSYLYAPRVSKQQVNHGMLGDMLGRVFGGSASAMVHNLLQISDLDAAELSELRRMINQKAEED